MGGRAVRGFGDGGKKLVGELAARSIRVDKDRASVVDCSVRPLEVCVVLLLLAPQCQRGEGKGRESTAEEQATDANDELRIRASDD